MQSFTSNRVDGFAVTTSPAEPGSKAVCVWVAALQFIAALTWTMYVLFLPGLFEQVGIDKRWILWMLVIDQVVFAVSDWYASAHTDRLLRRWRGVASPLMLLILLSAAMMAALPWVADLRQPALFVAVVVLWVIGSSALRAPAFSLLSEVGGLSNRAGTISWALVGLSLASALGPLLTLLLRQVDPHVPLALASSVLAMAALLTVRMTPQLDVPPQASGPARDVVGFVAVVYLAALGMQLHTALTGEMVAARFPQLPLPAFRTIFWLGFAAGLLVAARAARAPNEHRAAVTAMLVGTVAMLLVRHAENLAAFAVAQALAGGAWAVVFTGLLVAAIQRGGEEAKGRYLGLLFMATALAAMTRLLVVVADLQRLTLVGWLSICTWLLAALVLVVLQVVAVARPHQSAI
jgi:hypothetical protein